MRRVQDLKRPAQIIDQDILLRLLARIAPLQLLNVLVRQTREQTQIRRVSPQTDLRHLSEEQLFRPLDFLGVAGVHNRVILGRVDLRDDLLVSTRKFQHRRP